MPEKLARMKREEKNGAGQIKVIVIPTERLIGKLLITDWKRIKQGNNLQSAARKSVKTTLVLLKIYPRTRAEANNNGTTLNYTSPCPFSNIAMNELGNNTFIRVNFYSLQVLLNKYFVCR